MWRVATAGTMAAMLIIVTASGLSLGAAGKPSRVRSGRRERTARSRPRPAEPGGSRRPFRGQAAGRAAAAARADSVSFRRRERGRALPVSRGRGTPDRPAAVMRWRSCAKGQPDIGRVELRAHGSSAEARPRASSGRGSRAIQTATSPTAALARVGTAQVGSRQRLDLLRVHAHSRRRGQRLAPRADEYVPRPGA